MATEIFQLFKNLDSNNKDKKKCLKTVVISKQLVLTVCYSKNTNSFNNIVQGLLMLSLLFR